MEICSGLGEASVRHYLAGRHYYLAEDTLDLFDKISRTLGQPILPRVKISQQVVRRRFPSKRFALLVQLQALSESYDVELIRGIMREAARLSFGVGVYGVVPLAVSTSLEQAINIFRPDGVVMLRTTPGENDLEPLVKSGIPMVLVQADRYRFPQPVLANIVPNEAKLGGDLKTWIKRYLQSASGDGRAGRKGTKKVVLVTAPPEFPRIAVPPIATDVEPSLRNARITQMEQAMPRGFRLAVEEVPDYRFRHGLRVFQHHPDADLYMVPSNEIAVAIKHILIAAGQPWDRRIIGLDASPAAEEDGVTTFAPSIEKVSFLVIDQLRRFFQMEEGQPLDFVELQTDIHLETRCQKSRTHLIPSIDPYRSPGAGYLTIGTFPYTRPEIPFHSRLITPVKYPGPRLPAKILMNRDLGPEISV